MNVKMEKFTLLCNYPESHCKNQMRIVLAILCLLLGMAVDSCSSGIAHRKLHRAAVSRVPNQYFVHFKLKTTFEEGDALVEELQTLDADLTKPNFTVNVFGVIKKAGHGLAVNMSNEALDYVLNHTTVNFVEEDSFVRADQLLDINTINRAINNSWGLDRLDSKTRQYDRRYRAPCGLTGRGVDVYVLDSGLHYNHQHFSGRAQFSGCDFAKGGSRGGSDCNGHGTYVGGIIGSTSMGVAPDATLLSVRVLDCDRYGTWNTVLLGLECVLNRIIANRGRPAVINMSTSSSNKNRAIKRAIDRLIDRGVPVVSVSGNSKEDKSGNACKVTPGSIPGVITVAGTTKLDEIFNRTLLGRCVDILAPAKDITSIGPRCSKCIVSSLSGSSFAAPYVTGAIALLLEKCPKMPPWKVRYNLLSRMTTPSVLKVKKIVPTRFRKTTPNLLLHTGSEICSIIC